MAAAIYGQTSKNFKIVDLNKKRHNKHILFLKKKLKTCGLNIFQVNRRIYKGIPDSLRGEVWYRLLDIGRVKQEQNGVYEVRAKKKGEVYVRYFQ